MPQLDEVLYYLNGVRLLVRHNPGGFRWFDLSDRGFRRSFWALLLCFPLMLPNWVWWHRIFVNYGPLGVNTGILFYLRMALIEYVLWFVPLLTVGVFMWLRGLGGRFDTFVIVSNWLNVPVYLLTAGISLAELLIPAPVVLWYYVIQVQLAVVVIAQFSVYFMVVKKDWTNALGMTAASVLPSMIVSIYLNSFLTVSLGS